MRDLLSFATRAAFSSADPARQTAEVVIERFDAGSARSEAVYVCCGDSEPDHPLKTRNGDRWWMIHPDALSVEAAGASDDATGDCTRAMSNVLAYLAATGSARLRLHARDYVLASPARLVQRRGDPVLQFTIEGCGRGVSRLRVPRSGAFVFGFASDCSALLASGFSVVATGRRDAQSRCETAILARFEQAGEAERGHRSAVLSDLDVLGEDAAFETAVDLEGAADPLVRDCVFVAGTSSRADCGGVKFGLVVAPDTLPEELGT